MTDEVEGVGEVGSMLCCGIKEYKGTQAKNWSPRKALITMLRHPQWQRPVGGRVENAGFAGYVLTQAWESHEKAPTNFVRFKLFVEKRGLGTFTLCEPGGSGLYSGAHIIQVGVFTPDRHALFAWGHARGYIREDANKIHWEHTPFGGAVRWGTHGTPIHRG